MTTTQLRANSAQEPATPLCWTDLAKGDRIHHFDYGNGTIDATGPLFLFITWDDPNVGLNHHTAAMAAHLLRPARRKQPDDRPPVPSRPPPGLPPRRHRRGMAGGLTP